MKAFLSRKSQSSHVHAWYYRERPAHSGWVITGYVCKCGKVDYCDLVTGIAGRGQIAIDAV